MFKLLVVLSFIAVIQSQLDGGFPSLGGYSDHPELIEDVSTRALVRLVVSDLKVNQNLIVTPVKILSVQTQSMYGVTFKIGFTARSTSAPDGLTCTAVVHSGLGDVQTVLSVDCA
ncbi:unnamed protein product [Adineta steineri]|uniref:Uncharacterized protein n=1 Tax=Adineta steineri TaxID=433720 RepID=A0A818NIN4_9BILA|nr:unnamed protein product [Adineta steineri]CAF3607657.1 unnamed protein product [Adineta steineri]